MQVQSVAAPASSPAQQQQQTSAATNAFGLSFDALLKIVLTQLTYQDPLKPMDNFEFVSQLAQFSQIQQGQTTNDHLQQLEAVGLFDRATGLLGERVDFVQGSRTLSGKVSAMALQNGQPSLTIDTDDKQTISNVAPASVTQVRKE